MKRFAWSPVSLCLLCACCLALFLAAPVGAAGMVPPGPTHAAQAVPASGSAPTAAPAPTVALLSDDFEGAWAWDLGGWNLTDSKSYGGSHSAYCHEPADESGYMHRWPFDLRDATAATLDYDVWYSSTGEPGSRSGNVGWGYTPNVPESAWYFTGDLGSSGGWVHRHIDLGHFLDFGGHYSSLLGQSRVGIGFYCSGGHTGLAIGADELAYIDNVRLVETVVAPGIAVTSPTAASRWPAKSTQTVRWNLARAVSGGEFRVWLVSADNLRWHALKQVLPTAGKTSYSTPVTAGVPAGSYKVAVYWRPEVGVGSWTATAKSGAFVVTPIHITSPTATSSWKTGSAHSLTWTVNPAYAAVGEFRVWLVSADNLHWYVNKQVLPTAGKTTYATTVTASVPAGSYKAAVYYRPAAGSGSWTATSKSAAFAVTP